MKKICVLFIVVLSSLTAFGADQISVTINGESYICSGADTNSGAQVVSVFCECREFGGIHLDRVAIMSDGSSKRVSSTQLTPKNGSYNSEEIKAKCQAMVRQCR